MNGILDNLLVGLALLMSAGYALLTLGPRSLRRRLLTALGRAAAGGPAFLGVRRAAQRLIAAAADKPAGACGGCDDCGSDKSASAAEVRVPVEKIGRRV
jgi:hypothetical protein